MGKIVTLGEIMLRLSPAGYDRFSQAISGDLLRGKPNGRRKNLRAGAG